VPPLATLCKDVPFGGLARGLEFIEFFLKLRDAFLQLGFAPGKGLDLGRFNVAFQVKRAKLGDLPVEDSDPLRTCPSSVRWARLTTMVASGIGPVP
jgi:hypothetical protein